MFAHVCGCMDVNMGGVNMHVCGRIMCAHVYRSGCVYEEYICVSGS